MKTKNSGLTALEVLALLREGKIALYMIGAKSNITGKHPILQIEKRLQYSLIFLICSTLAMGWPLIAFIVHHDEPLKNIFGPSGIVIPIVFIASMLVYISERYLPCEFGIELVWVAKLAKVPVEDLGMFAMRQMKSRTDKSMYEEKGKVQELQLELAGSDSLYLLRHTTEERQKFGYWCKRLYELGLADENAAKLFFRDEVEN